MTKRPKPIPCITKDTVKPFAKWAGGKTRLLPEIVARLPVDWQAYHEPFVGGGALFFWLRSHANNARGRNFRAFISDVNAELINAYKVVQDDSENLIRRLSQFKHSKRFYYAMREAKPTTSVTRAARFMYLNRTCFNGLWRVNSRGEFNVPMGDYKNPIFCDANAIHEASTTLILTFIRDQPFEFSIDAATHKDFIYCDPPYLVDFTKYAKDDFTISDHERLAASLKKADKRGAFWMLSEADSPVIRKLFKGYNIVPVTSRHSVGATGDRRGKSKELLIMNYRKFMPWLGA